MMMDGNTFILGFVCGAIVVMCVWGAYSAGKADKK